MTMIDNKKDYIINRLNYSVSTKEELIGLLTMAIYSKEIFPTNKLVKIFVQEVFRMSFLDYVYHSRTLLCARLMRAISLYEDKDLKRTNKQIRDFFSIYLDGREKNLNLLNKDNKGNANKDMTKWIEGILGKNKK